MDLSFLKGLKLDSKDAAAEQTAPASAPASVEKEHNQSMLDKIGTALRGDYDQAQRPVVPGGSAVSDHAQKPVLSQHEHGSMLDKISGAMRGDVDHAQRPIVPPAPPSDPVHQSVFDKLGSAIRGDADHAQKPVVPPPAPEPAHHSVLDTIGSALRGDADHAQKPVVPPPPPEQKFIFDKIGDHLNPKPPPPPPQAEHKSIADKISDAIRGDVDHAQKPVVPPKHESMFDKINERLHPTPPAPQHEGLHDKINNVLGGGRKGEEKEDALDKSIDWVQEHVLKQGDQHNESAFEQAKDEKISDAIREQYKKHTGQEFPIKDKE